MRGLDLSEEYYREFGTRMIQEKFPGYNDRIAAGLVGDGSECYGFDDEISRDHDWGPGFCLWLTGEDHDRIGRRLQQEYESLPRRFLGFGRTTSNWGRERVGVFSIGDFYRRFIGTAHAPSSLEQWVHIPEEYLSACTSGKVFEDPLGRFSQIRRELLRFYPEDVRRVKIAARCMWVAQSGQYNYLRSVRRNELFATQYAETKFCADVMSLVFLLNRRYAPYYKWRHRALRELSILGKITYTRIGEMMATGAVSTKSTLIEAICEDVVGELRKQGLSEAPGNFLLDHGVAVHSRVRDDKLRRRSVWRA
jgi:hypothetical protein